MMAAGETPKIEEELNSQIYLLQPFHVAIIFSPNSIFSFLIKSYLLAVVFDLSLVLL